MGHRKSVNIKHKQTEQNDLSERDLKLGKNEYFF